MLVHVTSRNLLVVHNWQVLHEIIEPNVGNTNKYWLSLLPGFDEQKFPFIICSGWETYNLINISNFHMQVLVTASGRNTTR